MLDAMVLICYSTGSREILGYIPLVFGDEIALGFASCDLTAAMPTTREIYPEYHSCPCYNNTYVYKYSVDFIVYDKVYGEVVYM